MNIIICFFLEKDTFEEIQIYRLLLEVSEPDHILVRSVNAENHDEKSVMKLDERRKKTYFY